MDKKYNITDLLPFNAPQSLKDLRSQHPQIGKYLGNPGLMGAASRADSETYLPETLAAGIALSTLLGAISRPLVMQPLQKAMAKSLFHLRHNLPNKSPQQMRDMAKKLIQQSKEPLGKAILRGSLEGGISSAPFLAAQYFAGKALAKPVTPEV